MQSIQRVIKQSGDHLNAFFISLHKGFGKGGYGRVQTRGITSIAAISVVRRHPRVPGPGWILCSLFPVVQAWSPWTAKKEESGEKSQIIQTVRGLRLLNSKDSKLREDIVKADELYDSGDPLNFDLAYDILLKHLAKGEPEVYWRLGRLNFQRSKLTNVDAEKGRLVDESYEQLLKAMTLDDNNFAVHKWMAILRNERSVRKGIKEQILESVEVRNHMEKATELNPDDATTIYLLGNWCYTVADISWYQRQIAATLFATPPKCSFAEAYQYFLKAEYTQPGFYSMNLLMLAKTCIKLGDMEKAEEYLWELQKFKVVTRDDLEAKKEAKALRESYFKAKRIRETEGGAAEEGKI